MRLPLSNRWTIVATAVSAVAVCVAFGGGGGPTERARLAPSDGAAGDYFGTSSALSGDTAVFGASHKNFGEGAAYVFVRDGTAWTEQQRLVPVEPGIVYSLGFHVAIDGDTAVVGGISDVSGGFDNRETAYVFTRTGTTWTQQAKLAHADDATARQARAVDVAIDGDTIVVGSPRNSKVFVYTRTGTVWSLAASFTGSDAKTTDAFGGSVALNAGTLLVGAYGTLATHGAAYVFTGSGATWTEQAKLVAPDGANLDAFGDSVAFHGDTALVGAGNKNSGEGAVYVFRRTGSTWTQETKLTASDAAEVGSQGFGSPVAFADEKAVFGAAGRDSGRGHVYVFSRTGATWTETAQAAASDAASLDQFGTSVAFDGDTILVGAYAKGAYRGGAYVLSLTPGAPTSSGYCLPTKVKATTNAKHAEKSALAASGVLDFGTGLPDLSGAATFDVGGFHLDVPAFVAKGKTLTYSAGGVTLTITQPKTGAAHAAFAVKAVGDFAGRVDVEAPLTIRFKNAAHDVAGTANLVKGALGPHAVATPNVSVLAAAATVKGGGKDALNLTLGFATDGVVPAAAEDLTICFGGAFTSKLAGGWVRKGNAWTHAAKAPGITKATIDYVKGTITIAGAKLDLGAFADGANAVVVTIVRGGDSRSVGIRMVLAKTKLAY